MAHENQGSGSARSRRAQDTWDDAKQAAGPFATYVQKAHDAIVNAPDQTEAGRLKAFWEQYKANGDEMIANGATLKDLAMANAHAHRFAHVIAAGIRGGAGTEPTEADMSLAADADNIVWST